MKSAIMVFGIALTANSAFAAPVMEGRCSRQAAKIASDQLSDRAVAGHEVLSSRVSWNDPSLYEVEFAITDEFGEPSFDQAVTVKLNPRTCASSPLAMATPF